MAKRKAQSSEWKNFENVSNLERFHQFTQIAASFIDFKYSFRYIIFLSILFRIESFSICKHLIIPWSFYEFVCICIFLLFIRFFLIHLVSWIRFDYIWFEEVDKNVLKETWKPWLTQWIRWIECPRGEYIKYVQKDSVLRDMARRYNWGKR